MQTVEHVNLIKNKLLTLSVDRSPNHNGIRQLLVCNDLRQ